VNASATSVRWSVVLWLTVAALALRAFHVNAQSLWYDEIGSMKVIATPVAELAAAVDTGRVEPTTWLSMAYWAFAKSCVALSPWDPDTTMRFASALVGTATVPALAWALAPVLPANAVLASAAALAVSSFHVWYSQEVRPYVLLILIVTLAVGAYVRALARGGWGWWTTTAALVALALYTHPIALTLPAILGIGVLADARTDVRRALPGLAALAAAGLAFVPVLLVIRAHGANNPADTRGVGLFDLPYVIYAYAVGFSYGPSTTELHGDHRTAALVHALPAVAFAAVVFGALGVRGGRALRALAPRTRIVLWTWLVLPLGLTLTIALATANPLNARYGIVSFPAFVVLLGLGLADARRPAVAALAASALGISLVSVANLAFDGRYAKEDCRALGDALRAEATAEDLVLVNASYMAVAVRYYYPGPAVVLPYPPIDGGDRDVDVERAPGEVERLTAGHERVWLVATRSFHGDRAGTLPSLVGRGRVADRTLVLPGIVATRWVRAATG